MHQVSPGIRVVLRTRRCNPLQQQARPPWQRTGLRTHIATAPPRREQSGRRRVPAPPRTMPPTVTQFSGLPTDVQNGETHGGSFRPAPLQACGRPYRRGAVKQVQE